MTPEVKKAYLDGRLMLLLGAGASYGSQDQDGRPLPMGDTLAQEMANEAGWAYNNEPLSTVYSAFNNSNPAGLSRFLTRRFKNTVPSKEICKLVSYRWPRIYTLNIDDTLEAASRKHSSQKLQVFGRIDSLEDIDPIFEHLQVVKLNGTADRLDQGLIFSPQEYGQGSARIPPWYKELAQNYSSHSFVFIGSKLNEPLLHHVLADMRQGSKRALQQGYVITPSATPIEVQHLDALKLKHIPGTLADFIAWLGAEIKEKPSGWELAVARRPELKNLKSGLSSKQQRALNAVTVVSSDAIPRSIYSSSSGHIRDFYRGFKPRWDDILDEVPAELSFINDFTNLIQKSASCGKMIGLIGPAGSGKTTGLMMAALRTSVASGQPVYFLREAISNISELLLSLEELNDNAYYLFIDKVDPIDKDIQAIYEKSRISKGVLVFSERQNVWIRRVKESLGAFLSAEYKVNRISEKDVIPILDKLKRYGPWTRLETMEPKDRFKELFDRSNRQLLIGLMETTVGLGFNDIIRRDFRQIGSADHQKLLIIVGLATIHRSTISTGIAGRALRAAGVDADSQKLVAETEGVVEVSNGRLSARHPVYIRELFEKIVDPDLVMDCLVALLNAFADFKTPVIQHAGKADGVVFKSVINHRFIREMMRNDEARVRAIYGEFETIFHIDGLYWLQYGLALRGFNRHNEALDKFETARAAYNSPQIEHAYAQQLMILAEQASSWIEAEPIVIKAINSFRNRSNVGWEADTYPIVSLAEGHVSVFRKFHDLEASKELARQYARELHKIRAQSQHNERLEEAAKNLTVFATTGTWRDGRGIFEASFK